MGKSWERQQVKQLIQLIQKHEEVWNVTHPQYTKSKKIRHYQWKEITKLFNDSHKTNYHPSEVLSRWNTLKFNFEKEHRKMMDKGLERSKWFYYDELNFLSVLLIKKREASLDDTSKPSSGKSLSRDEEEDTDVSIGSISPQRIIDSEDKLRYSSGYGISTSDSGRGSAEVQDAFGAYVAMELNHLDVDLKFRAKKIIFAALMNLQKEQQERVVKV